MAALPRSEVSFRRQGSSGLVWDDKFLSGELNQLAKQQKEEKNNRKSQEKTSKNKPQQLQTEADDGRAAGLTIERSRSNGGRGAYRTGRVSPAIEPPSPKVSACGFCGAFGKNNKTRRPPNKQGKRVM